MAEQQSYMDSIISASDPFSQRTPSLTDDTGSSTSSYSDLATYQCVSPFALPIHCESDLSSVHHSQKLMGNLMDGYSVPEHYVGQVPSPSGNSRMDGFWGQAPFEMNSHPGSPMHTPVYAHAQGEYYDPERSGVLPPGHYPGSLAVSDLYSVPVSQPPYFTQPMAEQSPLGSPAGHFMSMEPQSRELSCEIPMAEPMLQDVEDSRSWSPYPGCHSTSPLVPIKQEQASPQIMSSPIASPRMRKVLLGNRRIKQSPTRKRLIKPNRSMRSAARHRDCYGNESAPWLKADCPDEEHLLAQAWVNVTRDVYKRVNDEFARLGGSPNMQVNEGDIEDKSKEPKICLRLRQCGLGTWIRVWEAERRVKNQGKEATKKRAKGRND
ncbi:hypothetical protein E4U41_000225 [Claviceps citrina]|nr:hypothetical protein E4U41_000225 [Claviceps citrina]